MATEDINWMSAAGQSGHKNTSIDTAKRKHAGRQRDGQKKREGEKRKTSPRRDTTNMRRRILVQRSAKRSQTSKYTCTASAVDVIGESTA